MTEIGTNIYFAFPYIGPMIEEVIKKCPKEFHEKRKKESKAIIKSYAEKLQSTVRDTVLKRGRVQFKIFGQDTYDKEIVDELTEEILKRTDIEGQVAELQAAASRLEAKR